MSMIELSTQSNRIWLEATEETPLTLLEKVRLAKGLHPDAEIYVSLLGLSPWLYTRWLGGLIPYGVKVCYSLTRR